MNSYDMQPTIALLSNINIEPLKSNLQQIGFGEVYVAGYNQWQNELLNAASWVRNHQPDYLLVYLHPDAGGYSTASEVTGAVRQYLQNSQHGTVIVSEYVGLPLRVDTYCSSHNEKEQQDNQQLYSLALSEQRVKILPLQHLVLLHGYTTLFDNKYWYLGRMKHSLQGYHLIARELQLFIRAIEGKSKKVLVLDFDNTLWGGVAGEDGWQNLIISNEGKGLIYQEFQQLIVDLQKSGVIVASCSKNNEADAKEVFTNNTNMVLSWSDFVTHRINWDNKDTNLQSIANELNLGIDAMVFIDDSPVERELVQHSLPEITVPAFPSDITTLPYWFLHEVVYPYFPKISLTQEDTRKTEQYQRNAIREKERQHLSFEAFIEGLSIDLKIEDAHETALARVAQLTQKTNQFNLTTRRYTLDAIKLFAQQEHWRIYTCSYKDKYGDEGIVGVVLIHLNDHQAHIDNFILSCRVLGRNVEFRIVDEILAMLKREGITKVTAEYQPSDRNQQVSDFYPRSGFSSTATHQYELTL